MACGGSPGPHASLGRSYAGDQSGRTCTQVRVGTRQLPCSYQWPPAKTAHAAPRRQGWHTPAATRFPLANQPPHRRLTARRQKHETEHSSSRHRAATLAVSSAPQRAGRLQLGRQRAKQGWHTAKPTATAALSNRATSAAGRLPAKRFRRWFHFSATRMQTRKPVHHETAQRRRNPPTSRRARRQLASRRSRAPQNPPTRRRPRCNRPRRPKPLGVGGNYWYRTPPVPSYSNIHTNLRAVHSSWWVVHLVFWRTTCKTC